MKKIKTIFQRDWEGSRRVVDMYIDGFNPDCLRSAVATEKLDGTNVRMTVRNHTLVRLEKRNNPTKIQKANGIEDPWYVDADEFAPGDKYMWEAARNTDLSQVPNGEWSGEAIGPKIQGNPLGLEKHTVALFSLGLVPSFADVPTSYAELKEWLPDQDSKYNPGHKIEGIVWHCQNGDMYKIKCKDFGV